MAKQTVSGLVLAVVLWAMPALAQAPAGQQPGTPAGPAPATQPVQIPVRQVVLFSSGVGYFEHFGKVAGDTRSELRFKTEQINDILKSLVLQDLDGGSVSTITYPSQDPLEKQLKSFQVDIAANPSLADLLNQLRGARVTVRQFEQPTTGTILGVERKKLPVGEGEKEQIIEAAVMNLLVDGGRLVAIKLDDVAAVELQDPQLQEELVRALGAVAQARDQDKKPVLINFAGQGERRVRLGYVVETPIWKTSYRLIVPAKAEEASPRLQGWAIVENQTDNDWDNVQLSLISGRPISFVMNLYQPLYVPRPLVELERFASLRPQTYAAGVDRDEQRGAQAGAGGARRSRMLKVQAADAAAAAPMAPAAEGLSRAEAAHELAYLAEAIDPNASIASVASASEIGELFQYTVGNVSLPRQKSAMIPIITDDVQVEKVSIYNLAVLARHPLNGARITNTTGKHLLQGPITVFDGNAYAGDAQINNVPPGQVRLVSYGVDLNVIANSEPRPHEVSLLGAKIVKGVLELTHRSVASQKYTLENKADDARTIIVEHPVSPDWKLLEPEKPEETTDKLYRFRLPLAADQTSDFVVRQEKVEAQAIALLPMDVTAVVEYARQGAVDPKVREALTTAAAMKQKLVDTERQLQQHQQQLAEITAEQNRIRENLRTVPQNSQYYTRLMTKLNDQESRIETLQVEADQFQQQLNAQRNELETYLNGLSVG